VLIEYFRKTQKEKSFLYELSGQYGHFAVSVVTEFEVYSGATQSQQVFWDNFFSLITILPFNSEAGRLAAEIYQQLKQKNRLIGIPDILISATALHHSLKLATLNEKDFARIDRLELISRPK